MLTNLPVPCDFCVGDPILHLLTTYNVCLAYYLNSVLNVKALVTTFNQEKALEGAIFVIVQFH